MIGNVENVVTWLKINDLKYWRVKVKEGDNATVFETTDGMTFDDNVSKFRSVMDISQGNRYTITASREKAQSKGNFFEEFKNMESSPSSIGNTQPSGVQGIPADEVEKRIEDAISRYADKLEMTRLKEDNADLKIQVRESDTALNRIITRLEPVIGTIITAAIGKFIPQAPQLGIAGIDVETQNIADENEVEVETESDDAARLQIALEKWMKADPECISIIEIVSNMAASGNPMYTTAKRLLKTM